MHTQRGSIETGGGGGGGGDGKGMSLAFSDNLPNITQVKGCQSMRSLVMPK